MYNVAHQLLTCTLIVAVNMYRSGKPEGLSVNFSIDVRFMEVKFAYKPDYKPIITQTETIMLLLLHTSSPIAQYLKGRLHSAYTHPDLQIYSYSKLPIDTIETILPVRQRGRMISAYSL